MIMDEGVAFSSNSHRRDNARKGNSTTKSLKCAHYVMVESLNMQGVEEDWQLKVLQETDNL